MKSLTALAMDFECRPQAAEVRVLRAIDIFDGTGSRNACEKESSPSQFPARFAPFPSFTNWNPSRSPTASFPFNFYVAAEFTEASPAVQFTQTSNFH